MLLMNVLMELKKMYGSMCVLILELAQVKKGKKIEILNC